MSVFTPEQQAEMDAKFTQLRTDLAAQYGKADSFWQKYRREHPLAVQNIILFGVTPLVGFLGYLIGHFAK